MSKRVFIIRVGFNARHIISMSQTACSTDVLHTHMACWVKNNIVSVCVCAIDKRKMRANATN